MEGMKKHVRKGQSRNNTTRGRESTIPSGMNKSQKKNKRLNKQQQNDTCKGASEGQLVYPLLGNSTSKGKAFTNEEIRKAKWGEEGTNRKILVCNN